MKSGKWQMTEGIELPNQNKIRTSGEMETYTYLGILKVDTVKYAAMKEKKKRKRILQANEKTTPN